MSEHARATLLVSSRTTEDNQLIWRAAVQRGWSVERVRGLRLPEIVGDRIVLYMESLFAPTVAQQLGLELAETSMSWLPALPQEYRRRDVRLTTLAEVPNEQCPLFIKPPNEKSFPAQVYEDTDALLRDYEPDTAVLVASPVQWMVEFRCFCLDGCVRTLSPYLREGQLCRLDGFSATEDELEQARGFAERVLRDARVHVPRAIVLDAGTIAGEGWAVVEANAAWGSGIYGCDPDEVLNVLEHATVKNDE